MTSISISFISILIFWSIFFFSQIYCFFLFEKDNFFFHVYLLLSWQIFHPPMRVSSLQEELESCIFQKCQCFIRSKMCLAEFQMMMLECKKHFERASAKILNTLISNCFSQNPCIHVSFRNVCVLSAPKSVNLNLRWWWLTAGNA